MAMPLRWSLPADHASAGLARGLVLGELGGRAEAEDVALAASELITNAVEHGLPPIDLELDVRPHLVRVAVSNGTDGAVPHERTASSDDPGGRGLAMVGLLATRWGWDRDHGRLTVWAEFGSP